MKMNKGLFVFLTLSTFLISGLFHNSLAQRNIEGEWSAPIQFGIVPVAVANLPDGRLLTWSSQFRNTFIEAGDGATFSQYFDPFSGANGNVDGPEFTINTDHDMFCPGINNLPDGRLLSAGGTTSNRTSIFDPATGQWSVAARMNIPRGYQGNVTTQDGSVLTLGGSWSDSRFVNGGKDAEIWSPTTGWIMLPNIQGSDIFNANDLALEQEGIYRVDNHLWLWAAPNGKIFHAGPSEMMHWIDVDVPGGDIVDAGIRQGGGVVDSYSMKGNTVMFDTGKILKVGGATQYGQDENTNTPSKQNSFIIDLNGVAYGNTPSVQFSGNMAFPRIYQNSTVLPNGEVLVTGGSSRAALFSDAFAVLETEIFSETTGWRTAASMSEARTYHSVAILMPNGKVFAGGSGLCDDTPGCVNHFNAEIYSPPYLFDSNGNEAVRPEIISVNNNTNLGNFGESSVAYNSTIQVTTNSNVTEFSLIRFSSATHATNNEQRRIPLTTTAGTTHSLNIPDRNLLPPGYYMLFALNADGVPSIAKSLKIGDAVPLAINNPNKVIEFKFDENSPTTTITDSSGNGNDGTVVEREDDSTPRTADDHQFSAGLFGNALELNGKEFNSNSIIDIPLSTSIRNIKDKMTISAWIWRDPASIVPEDGNKIANVAVFAYNYDDNFFGFHNSLYKWSFRTTNGFVDVYSGYAPLAGWNHIVGAYDGSAVRLYANGKEIGMGTITGDIKWDGGPTDDPSVTVSGFYDDRTLPFRPWGNQSGITDEIDGKIDELTVYNVALGDEEIANLYAEGLAVNNANVPNCVGVSVGDIEYKLNSDAWKLVQSDRITAQEGDEILIRPVSYNAQYFVTTSLVDGPTFDSTTDLNADNAYQLDTGVFDATPGDAIVDNDGLLDFNDQGYFVMTTAAGCPKTIFVEVLGSCEPGETAISAEYNVNGTWFVGNAVTLQEGDSFRLSIVPNIGDNPEAHPATIKLPNGSIVPDGFLIDPIEKSHEGRYTFISAQGCTDILDVSVDIVNCSTLNLQTEYQIDGGAYIAGATQVNINAGSNLRLSVLPNTVPFSVTSTSANNRSKPNSSQDLFLNNITPDDAGIYTFTTASGCSTTLDVVVAQANCSNIRTEYQINNFGAYIEGASTVSVDEGNNITLSIQPNGIPYSISSDANNGNSKPEDTADLVLNNLSADDAGTYTFTTNTGCVVTLNLIVNQVDCANVALQTQYDINNANNFIAGQDVVRVDLGATLQLSVVPDNFNQRPLAFTISGPNNNNKPLNPADLTLTNIQEADEGLYTMTTASGCQTTLLVLAGTNEDPEANFTVNPTSGNTATVFGFDASTSTDDDTVNPLSYAWNFGDGNTATTINPTHTFSQAGTYQVVLTVTDTEGGQDVENITIVVTSTNQAPVASANANTTTITLGAEIDFDSSASTDDNGIVSYSWDFDDGNTATQANPSHTYTQSGNYTVKLTVTDAEGLTDEATISVTVNEPLNQAPTAVASSSATTVPIGTTVNFSSAGSTDDNAITSYQWNFGDGNTSAVPNPDHTYSQPGSYTVTLTVSDAEGLSDTANLQITAEGPDNQAPSAIASADQTSISLGTEINFSSTGSTDDNAITSYQWNFGDGNSAIVANPAHTYSAAGVYTVALTVTDEAGLQDIANIQITVLAPENQAPIAALSADQTTVPLGTEISFSSAGSTDDKGITGYQWNFGDGNSSTDANPAHTYSAAGVYTVQLTVTDEEGLQDTATLQLTIEEVANQAPVAAISADPSTVALGTEINFSSAGSTDDKGITSYQWNFGDGNSSTDANPAHTYSAAGVYTVQLTITDEEGLQDTATLQVTIEEVANQAPVAAASADQTTVPLGTEISFSSVGSTDDKGITNYQWNFGDGNSSTDANPAHTYSAAGVYTVQLTVTDEEGLQDTATLQVTIEEVVNQAPVAAASADQTTVTLGTEINFNSSGSSDDKDITAYNWNFGDGNSSTEANPVYTYGQVGNYTVTLTVTDEAGLQDTTTLQITIAEPINEAPVAVISSDKTSGNAPVTIAFNSDDSTDDNGIVNYSWDFGNGDTSTETNPNYTFNTPGSYTVTLTVTDAAGLTGQDDITVLVENGNTPNSVTKTQLRVAPNPTQNGIANVFITLPEDKIITKMGLYDSSGKLWYTFSPDNVFNNGQYNIPVGTVSNGIYYLKVNYNEGDADAIRILVRN